MIDLLTEVERGDYYEQLPYDRSWIYRAYHGDTIVDVIWSMANHRAPVDDQWLQCRSEIEVRGEWLQVLPAEEVLWNKLHILHRDRCDWPDVLNLIHLAGDRLDWNHLLERVGEDVSLLHGVVQRILGYAPVVAVCPRGCGSGSSCHNRRAMIACWSTRCGSSC